jgi:uncharacterized protein (TIGR03437 family)
MSNSDKLPVTQLISTFLTGMALCSVGAVAYGQTLNPTITGIGNAASGVAGPLAPRMIGAAQGANLTNSAVLQSCDSAILLPLSCNGASVLVNGKPVPVIDAAPSQITFQVPVDISGSSASVQVTIQAASQTLQSNVVTVPIVPTNPGLFTLADGNTILGAFEMIKTVTLDPAICVIIGNCTAMEVVMVNQSAPAHPGDTVHIFGTGLGASDPAGLSGNPPPSDAKLVNGISVSVGGQNAGGVIANPAGPVGQDYISFTVPAVPMSGNVPVIVTSGTAPSPAVLLPVSVLQSAIRGVSNSATGGSGIESGSWVSIYGTDLSVTTRSWQITDFSGNALPLSLDGVSVTVNGRPAAVAFISPGQVNVQAPADTTAGPVEVSLRNASASATGTAILQDYAPGFFAFQGKYVAAVHSDGAYVAPVGYLGNSILSRPAKPGEVLMLFGTGFGPTSPSVPAGQVFFGAVPLTDISRLHIRIAGTPVAVQFAGIVAAGEYQFNVVVPACSDGDQTIVADIGGVLSQPDLLIPIKN